jgi:DNA polymerase (family X)
VAVSIRVGNRIEGPVNTSANASNTATAASNARIAAVFEEIADLLELQRANPFRIRAYRDVARTIASWPRTMAEIAAAGEDFDALPGIGEDLAGKIVEILRSGSCALLDRLRSEFPPGISDLLRIPGIGPATVRTLYHELGIRSVAELQRAARDGKIRGLHGFGAASERRIAQAVSAHLERDRRWPIAQAEPIAEAILAHLRAVPGVRRAIAAGSFRRRRETVGDLDILVSTDSESASSDVAKRFTAFPQVARVLAAGHTRASVVLANGLQVDLRIVRPDSFGAALLYFTGSKPHNIALRRIARSRGLKINEYGMYRDRERIAGATESSMYRTIGLPCIEPELREDRGEIEAARDGTLRRLIERADLRGDLHAHTDASDGHDPLRRMAEAARAAGLEYLAITDHSRSLAVAHGLDARRLCAQADAIDRLNEQLPGIVLLKGVEAEILADGRLDLAYDILGRLDLVVGAIHSAFDLSRARQTDRLLRAMDHPNFSLLAHPNGRLLGHRDGCDIDMERVLRHARERGCWIELNAHPDRLDLFDTQCRMAKDAGVPVAICSDAHGGGDFANLRYGIDQARRGWLEAGDVINTLPLTQLRKRLAATMRHSSR